MAHVYDVQRRRISTPHGVAYLRSVSNLFTKTTPNIRSIRTDEPFAALRCISRQSRERLRDVRMKCFRASSKATAEVRDQSDLFSSLRAWASHRNFRNVSLFTPWPRKISALPRFLVRFANRRQMQFRSAEKGRTRCKYSGHTVFLSFSFLLNKTENIRTIIEKSKTCADLS